MAQLNQRLGPVVLGDQIVLTFPLVDADGAAWSPTATAAQFMAKTAKDDPDADAVLSETLGAGVTVVGSTATVTVTQADQAALTASVTLYWSLRITTAADGPQTVGAGTLKIVREAVRT